MSDGQLCYLDFGMMGQIDKPTRRALIRATLHLVNREYNQLAEDFVTLGFLPSGADKSLIVPALTGFTPLLCQIRTANSTVLLAKITHCTVDRPQEDLFSNLKSIGQ